MDQKLVAWARAVKARRRARWPVLWVFSDWQRLPDPSAVVRSLPPGLCGVVLRPPPGWDTGRVRGLARLCKGRRVALSVAGALARDAGPDAGQHASRGRRSLHRSVLRTCSAHGVAEIQRARRAGARLVFLSPVFPTASHAGVTGLGPGRWCGAARRCVSPVLALGGVTAATARRLPRRVCGGAGVIGAAL